MIVVWKASSLRDNGQDFRKLSKACWARGRKNPIRQYLKCCFFIFFIFFKGSMAKYAASKCATSNAHECIQILGAKGFVSGAAERYYRDARITQIYGGATDIQKLVIADLVIKEARKRENQLD